MKSCQGILSLEEAMPSIRKEYLRLEAAVSRRGQKKYKMIKEDIDGRRLIKLPFRNEEVKVVVSLGPLGFIEQFPDGIQELDRILKPKGKIAIAIWIKTGKEFKDGVYYHPRDLVIRAFRNRFKIQSLSTLYTDGDRELLGITGLKPKRRKS